MTCKALAICVCTSCLIFFVAENLKQHVFICVFRFQIQKIGIDRFSPTKAILWDLISTLLLFLRGLSKHSLEEPFQTTIPLPIYQQKYWCCCLYMWVKIIYYSQSGSKLWLRLLFFHIQRPLWIVLRFSVNITCASLRVRNEKWAKKFEWFDFLKINPTGWTRWCCRAHMLFNSYELNTLVHPCSMSYYEHTISRVLST